MKYPRIAELLGLVNQKLVTSRHHPTLPLFIYNYTATAQALAPSEWTPTMRDARGLILDGSGEIVARPFPKFWNYEQMLDVIPAEQPVEIREKMDGSLGIVANYQGELVVATRGSFESEQAQWFTGWLRAQKTGFLPSESETWLFEIIYPENRIVVDYGERREAVLLAALKNETAEDLPEAEIAPVADLWAFSRPTRYTSTATLRSLALSMDDNKRFAGQEGFVARFANGLRVKLKLAEYKRLHRLVTQCSTRTIWELLRSGKPLTELLSHVPPDFSRWVTNTANDLSSRFEAIMGHTKVQYRFIQSRLNNPLLSAREHRKAFAAEASQRPHPSLYFSLLDGQDITDAVWKLVEPDWATPFRPEADRIPIGKWVQTEPGISMIIDDPQAPHRQEAA